MYKGSNCDRKSQLSEILTEPLNPRAVCKTKLSKPAAHSLRNIHLQRRAQQLKINIYADIECI